MGMGALDGLKILDLSRVLAGPYCTQMLGDLGATVWKVEPIWGDETRAWGPPFDESGLSAYFLSVNRNKELIAIDLKSKKGQELIRKLAMQADVLVENFKVGDLARKGLDYESLRGINPRLVYASITGFGQTGPRAKEPGYDAVIQGYTGIMSVTGEPEGAPMKVGIAWIDMMTGMHAAVAILAALRQRDLTGDGQHLDLSLFDTGIAALANVGQSYLMFGREPMRWGNAHPQIVPYGAFQCPDGWITLAVGNDAQFERVVTILNLPVRHEWQTNAGRVANRQNLEETVASRLIGESRAIWLARFQEAGIPCGPVNTIPEALADPQALARGFDPAVGLLPSPFGFMSDSEVKRSSTAGSVGKDSESILRDVLGLSDSDITKLGSSGVIRAGA